MLQLVPVIDLLNGHVVRGIAGNRDHYQHNVSCLLEGSSPVPTALAFKEKFNVDAIYVADLDGLEGRGVSEEVIRELAETGLKLTVDAGVTTAAMANRLLELGVAEVVVPLESLETLSSLSEILDAIDPERTVFSLDIKNGKALGKVAEQSNVHEIAMEAINLGVRQTIVLDLAGVGCSQGVLTSDLCHELKVATPDVRIWSGGGVRNIEDIAVLEESLLDGVLVASALHDGAIESHHWGEYRLGSD